MSRFFYGFRFRASSALSRGGTIVADGLVTVGFRSLLLFQLLFLPVFAQFCSLLIARLKNLKSLHTENGG